MATVYIVNCENKIIDQIECVGGVSDELLRWMSKRLPILDSYIVVHAKGLRGDDKFVKYINGCIDHGAWSINIDGKSID